MLRRSYGIQFFDTAEGYGGGTSEERLGDLLAWEHEEQGRAIHQSPTIIGTKFLPHLARWTSRSLSRALRSSNSRLGLQASDIYFIHTPVHPMPLEHWVAAAAKEANKGNAKAIGLSNCNADQVLYPNLKTNRTRMMLHSTFFPTALMTDPIRLLFCIWSLTLQVYLLSPAATGQACVC